MAIVKAEGKDFSKTVSKKFPSTRAKLASYVKKKVGIPTPHALISDNCIGSKGRLDQKDS